jgi:TnpA family transposase
MHHVHQTDLRIREHYTDTVGATDSTDHVFGLCCLLGFLFAPRIKDLKDRKLYTFENQSFRASGLSLITGAIVHWNTVYLDRAVRQLRAQGVAVPDDLLAHIAPLGWEHIALTGDYLWSTARPEAGFRSLREVRAAFLPQAA